MNDEFYLTRALELAQRAACEYGEVPVAAILVCGDLVVEAANEKERRPDPTAHAEILVLREAARRLKVWRLLGATVYITKEPCMMCAGALIAARIDRIVFGAYDPKAGAAGSVINLFTSSAVNHHATVVGGMLEAQAAEQLRRFFVARRQAVNHVPQHGATLALPPVIDTLVACMSAFPSVQKIILYGSRAKGTQSAFSDIDIAVVGVGDRREWANIRRLADVEDDRVRTLLKIDVVQFEHVDPAVQQSIREEGRVLYERP